MDPLYHQTNRLLQEIEQNFQKLAQSSGNQDSSEIENDIQMKISTVSSNCDRLDVLLYKVPASQRPSTKMRIDQLKYDMRHLQNSLQLFREKRQRRQIEISEREQLLNYRFTANHSTNAPPETCLDIDYALQQHTSLGNSHRGVDDMIASGGNILSSLINQRETLKGAHQRLVQIGSTLGLSNHTMKLIERRFTEDKYVMFAGMAVTLIIIGLVIYFIVF